MAGANASAAKKALNSLKLDVPQSYIEHLVRISEPVRIRDADDHRWWLMSADALQEPYELNNWKGVPFAHAIRQFIRMHQVGRHTIMELIKTKELSLEELGGCACIGEGIDGGALLMIEPNSGAVYAYVDGGWILERRAESFEEFISQCTID